jgi:hypothetical protein
MQVASTENSIQNREQLLAALENIAPEMFIKEVPEIPELNFTARLDFLTTVYKASTDSKFRREYNIKTGKTLDASRVAGELGAEIAKFCLTTGTTLSERQDGLNRLKICAMTYLDAKEQHRFTDYLIELQESQHKFHQLNAALINSSIPELRDKIKLYAQQVSLVDSSLFMDIHNVVDNFVGRLEPAFEAALVFGDNGVFDFLEPTGLIRNTVKFWAKIKEMVRERDFSDLEARPVSYTVETNTHKALQGEMTKLWKRAQEALNNFALLLGLTLIGEHNEHFIMGEPPSRVFGEGNMERHMRIELDKLATHQGAIEVRKIQDFDESDRPRRSEISKLIRGFVFRVKDLEVFIQKLLTEQFSQFFWDEQKKTHTGLLGIGDVIGGRMIIDSPETSGRRKLNENEQAEQDKSRVLKIYNILCHTLRFHPEDIMQIPFKNLGNGEVNFLTPISATAKNYFPEAGAPSIKGLLHFCKIVVIWAGYATEIKAMSPAMDKRGEDPDQEEGHRRYREKQEDLFKRKIAEYPQLGFAYMITKYALLGDDCSQDPLLDLFLEKYSVTVDIKPKKITYTLSAREAETTAE